ncbi:hypothetical protein [Mucilaginibacter sp. FT3.2]|uniref:hypothetical protein n=1 Tax=Mucilaginibacter sp. FT3.2 TaxID=2723090 RepID=UPI00160D6C4A|nr:hypothetical protein [Mucilaginibacter sp. FT3.2]MBB6235361.1 hypothetical protein [Mucilaginibacter sp. FT3.2]
MANIQFNYLYRDAGNYKNFGSVIFANPSNIGVTELSGLIQSNLIDQTWFYNHYWHLPDLRPKTFNNHTDPTWHEFERVGYTDEAANFKIELSEFIKLIMRESRE